MRWVACSDVDWEELDIGVDLTVHDGWCRDPKVPEDADDIGFIGCKEDLDRAHLERRLRSEGFDPLGVPVVLLTDVDRESGTRIRARVASTAARAAEYRGCGPEHLKPVMPPVISRRSFLAFRSPAYRVVPHPDDSCGAADGCRACVAVCPHGALDWSRGSITQDRLSCAGCGRCVAACPVSAMVNPSFTPEQLNAEIMAIGREVDRFGVILHCARGAAPAAPDGWYNVALPCVGMVPPHWVLAPLFLGAAAVTVSPCGCGKELDADERSRSAVAFARLWLSLSDITPEQLVVDKPSEVLPITLGLRVDALVFGAGGAAALAEVLAVEPVRGEASPLGLVTIDDATCTGCEMCATVCPSAGLRSVPDDGLLSIEFDPASCTACGQCVDRCPESGALKLSGVVDAAELELGKRTVVTHQLALCVKCGGTVAPQAALDRVAAALGDQPTILKQITSVCLDCRGTTMVF